MYETRKDFLKQIKQRAGLASLEEADRLSQVVISLIKARLGPELCEEIEQHVPPDLAKGWRNIALPSEAMELQEMMMELEEVGEAPQGGESLNPPEYG
ncbi:MAG: DUF2267 domain-containing protein [Deltaproteobacteria bacterium]|nr:DUF2267 domain-containing protein [Deltaproteobacteria bacterium]